MADVADYHYVMSWIVISPDGDSQQYGCADGTVGSAPGETRADVFRRVRDYVTANRAVDDGALHAPLNILSFTLERNELP